MRLANLPVTWKGVPIGLPWMVKLYSAPRKSCGLIRSITCRAAGRAVSSRAWQQQGVSAGHAVSTTAWQHQGIAASASINCSMHQL